jgi:dCMP deaminase
MKRTAKNRISDCPECALSRTVLGRDRRPSWDEYFMAMALLTAKRSTCLRRGVGAILVKDKEVLSTGYNGAPKGLKHCIDTGCVRTKRNIPSGKMHELCRAVHAEQNAIVQAAVFGISVAGATLYSTTFPCVICAKMLINSGVREIIFLGDYEDGLSRGMLKEGGVKVRRFRGRTA